ncbi:FIG00952727: hypothetical protein [hydrothermal vent metagenome]|uniref:Uncharacterized protein n=1 Tax=hydrothermal vent metagenome TaxID=652676 RepID=A0A3B0U4E7_9ZZZZ
MKKINLLLVVMSLVFGAAFLNSCRKDETAVIPDAPSVTAPSSTISVDAEQSVEVSFTINSPGGFASANANAQGGSVTILSQPEAASTSGTIVVSFTAGTIGGTASVTVTVNDVNQKSDNATAVLSVAKEEIVISVGSNISSNTTWKTGKVYILETRISVLTGVTLTIEPGVVIKGKAGTGANATALIIARGATIMAEGTAAAPIIFTSIADEIMPGEIASPNLEPDLNGLWGGLIVLGSAPISADAESQQIEGIPASDQNGLYGGTTADDNSGVIKYISIRHGGANIGEGNEINGLTLGGVGSGTIIENVEIVSNQDDGIEWFGGTVNVKNALLWNVGDDAVDTDQAWAGTIDNFVIINPGDECFELDGPEGSYNGAGHTIKNGTVSVEGASGLIDFDANTDVNMKDIYFFNLSADGGQDVEEYDKYSANANGFASSGFQVTLPAGIALTDVFKGGSDAITTVVDAGAATVGADLTQFSDWTWASVAGELAF